MSALIPAIIRLIMSRSRGGGGGGAPREPMSQEEQSNRHWRSAILKENTEKSSAAALGDRLEALGRAGRGMSYGEYLNYIKTHPLR